MCKMQVLFYLEVCGPGTFLEKMSTLKHVKTKSILKPKFVCSYKGCNHFEQSTWPLWLQISHTRGHTTVLTNI